MSYFSGLCQWPQCAWSAIARNAICARSKAHCSPWKAAEVLCGLSGDFGTRHGANNAFYGGFSFWRFFPVFNFAIQGLGEIREKIKSLGCVVTLIAMLATLSCTKEPVRQANY